MSVKFSLSSSTDAVQAPIIIARAFDSYREPWFILVWFFNPGIPIGGARVNVIVSLGQWIEGGRSLLGDRLKVAQIN